ncbi:MAG: hypothetical protein JW941_09070 [Candidatus Coatesbacteria bacterium]|nr:hypothetical protein [Candidatus Coatesbacteria bacterium]
MSSGQMILALGAIVMLSTLALTLNSIMLDGNKTMMESELYISGTSVAQSFIEHAAILAFDASVGVQDPSTFPGTFTSPYSLGPKVGENYPNFSDVDDFNGYSATVSTTRVDFIVNITVQYCDEDGNVSGSRTNFKIMTVNVSSPFLPTDVTATRIFSYSI